MKKNKILKIFAAVIAFALIGVVLFFINAFCGNPVSYLLAKYSAGQYIEDNFPESDYEIENVSYFFKESQYSAKVKSQSSIDSHFSIKIDFFGNISYVSYEDNVLNKGNTKERISREYFDKVVAVLETDIFPYETDYGYGMIRYSDEEECDSMGKGVFFVEELELDMSYDIREIGKNTGKVDLCVREDVTVENAAIILKKTKQLLNSADVYFYSIDFTLMEKRTDDNKIPEKSIHINNFLASYIDEDNLEEKIEIAIKETEEYYNEMYNDKQQEIDAYNKEMATATEE